MKIKISKIQEQLSDKSQLPTPKIKKTDNTNPKLKKGQVWSVKNSREDIESYFFLVTEILDSALVNVNVLFRWTELAGPEDLILPKIFMGSRATLSFELSATVSSEEFDYCIGCLPEDVLDYLRKAEKDLLEAYDRPPFNWGYGYLNEYDHRYAFHEKIVKDLEKMQYKIMDKIFDANPPVITIPFPQESKRIAAGGDSKVKDVTYKVNGYDNICLIVSEVDNSSLCNFNVYDENDSSNILAGAKIFNSSGIKVAEIENNCAEFSKDKITEGFYLEDKENQAIELIKEQNAE